MTVVLKLGGSVVTEKDRAETIDGAALDHTADAIADAISAGDIDDLVVVHGGGSFGHHHASEFGVSTTDGSHDVDAVHAIHGAMTTLNQFVLRRLLDRDVPAVPVHPFSAGHRSERGELTFPAGQIETLLSEGFVPVLHGDLVAHAGEGVTVVSGDELVVELAASLGADRVGLCSAVPGVLDDADAVIDRIDEYEDVADVLGESEATDVSGGMAAKVRALLDLDSNATIFGRDGLSAFLEGDDPGTTID
ncbi:aspartate/glutamate/uridylate kinase [Halovivax asiaticus JCM 14624]|uniref:Isopentenyl phosphate kinase n=1 Tax=Halovivax asiaticus JCM 14624 TaxID=1227490 RepID=M0B841_9EURY|nr:isopentenyl phosphate kinase [Halovivax asiaticus]ELZ07071.1 aspartate/glutamate/uridylate kinase [Halovivax asiaticus JCM 14624]